MSAPYATSTGVVSSGKTVYDFRSDTATIPTAEMLQAMVTAEVGDDVRDEDPTVHALQKKVSELCGKESALFITR
jgi:threonine aldolase